MATKTAPAPEEIDLRKLLASLRAARKGDFSVRMPLDLTGIGGEIADAFNAVLERNQRLTEELKRVGRTVGKEGKIATRIRLDTPEGGWAVCEEAVNELITDLVQPTREISRVIGAVAKGDLSQQINLEIEGRPLKGEFHRIARTANTMVSQLGSFADEVTRVAREVGTEGKLGGQAHVKGVAGIWKDLTDNVNLMADNITNQVRNIAEVTTAVARGDLSKKVTVEVRGEILELKNTVNTMVDQLNSFAGEVTRVAREVGTEGKLGGQAHVRDVAGIWKDLTDNVNLMADNLTSQVRNIADVTTAVARGDLSKKITVEVQGEILQLKNTINTMVDQLGSFADEVTRVAREVGTEGKLGGQARVKDVAGVWKDLTDNVNLMAQNLTSQVRNIADVTTAVANGDLSKKISVEVQGEILELKNTVNKMVDQLGSFADEVTRVAREVGTEGKLGGQARVEDVAGIWKDLTDNVNLMADNLTNQVRNIAEVTTAVATGDLSKKITVEVRGEILELKNTINTMVDQLGSFADEVTRVAREVGTEGKLGGQARVVDVAGVWRDLTENVNSMAANLTNQVRNIAEVTTAVAKGDLSKKITVEVQGEILELKNTINTMVDQLNSFASEVTRVAREVGTEGKLGGQAQVKGVAGTWKDLTDNVNFMAANLTNQVRNIADVTTAVANGDLSKKITVEVQGEILELKNTINTMVDQLNSFASEVTRVARDVGTEGKLGGQANVLGGAGIWKDLTDNVNQMAENLTDQVRNIADVTTAVANGDLSKKITVEARGEVLELKSTVNTMVDQLSSFADEVTRMAREVGVEGSLGGQALVKGVAGIWKDLTDNVNMMASNLTNQVRNIAEVTTAVAKGDLSRKVTVDVRGEILELKNTVNTMVDQLNSFANEVTRVAREVGTEGKLGGQAHVKGVAGVWKDLTDNVNFMAANLTSQVRNIAEVTTAVANGNLSRKITVDVKGEMLELKNTINTMVDQLNSFASEVTRVAREVGTEGKLEGQAQVLGVAGIWKDLTDNVNQMAQNLTSQVRGIAKVVTAVANGDLKRKLTVEAKGEIAALADTINSMTDTLATFADQVTTVAREVGVEGRLGGQASVPGAAGTWKDLTENVNQLAANLTGQVRAIAEVATAVTKGDLTATIKVDARGEVASLKDNINEMIRNLRETTLTNTEQDWLKSNLARFTRLLQGHKDLRNVTRMILSELAPLLDSQHGAFFLSEVGIDGQIDRLGLTATYAYRERKYLAREFAPGEGLVGQCAIEAERILLTNVPHDYVQINSGLGEAAPLNIVVLPVVFEGQVRGVIELASFTRFTSIHLAFLDQLAEIIGITINTIEAMMRTEELLKESQALAKELQSQPQLRLANERLEQQAAALQASEEMLKQQKEELRLTNEELADKARLLMQQKDEVERTNRQLEQARQALEEKAEQLTLTSKYKSEFLANMSHELRTPLNSLLILAKLLSQNKSDNMNEQEIEAASTIYAAGVELLNLINDILDLSKIESGTIAVEVAWVSLDGLREYVERNFRGIADSNKLEFQVLLEDELPDGLQTDPKRLQQILKNLLSNAFKFTPEGGVELTIRAANDGWSEDHAVLGRAGQVVAFEVRDTGVGIPLDQQEIIFEAFQQVDGTVHRRFGGTGLGLSISRELARLLGGEIVVKSVPGQGSVFTLYLPVEYLKVASEMPSKSETRAFSGTQVAEFPAPAPIPDDRESLLPSDRVVLIVEDEPAFSRILIDIARGHGFKAVVAQRFEAALTLVERFNPDAVTLDLNLPDGDGWMLLDILKHDPRTRHIPVQIISVDENTRRGYSMGAYGVLQKPVSADQLQETFTRLLEFVDDPTRRLLVVEDDAVERKTIVDFIADGNDVEAVAVGTAEDALIALSMERFMCIVLDLRLPDLSGWELLEIARERHGELPPVIIYTGVDLSQEDLEQLSKVSSNVIVKDVDSPERLIEATSLYLHREETSLSDSERALLRQAKSSDPDLTGRRVLVVDDDDRNLMAIRNLLEGNQMLVEIAHNGKEALGMLNRDPDFDIILMDIMMPEMDGYATSRAIRRIPRLRDLPIVALTAKAMPGDREKCLEAGATDYIPKPVDTDKLLSLLRVLLFDGE
ncbi:MAG: HAMP domain-containing protein [Vulcanimicrobiota bacterium]